jgi:hypothetical protein
MQIYIPVQKAVPEVKKKVMSDPISPDHARKLSSVAIYFLFGKKKLSTIAVHIQSNILALVIAF